MSPNIFNQRLSLLVNSLRIHIDEKLEYLNDKKSAFQSKDMLQKEYCKKFKAKSMAVISFSAKRIFTYWDLFKILTFCCVLFALAENCSSKEKTDATVESIQKFIEFLFRTCPAALVDPESRKVFFETVSSVVKGND